MVIAGIYGMNFKAMPELQWAYGYPFALGLMVATTFATYLFVRIRGLQPAANTSSARNPPAGAAPSVRLPS